MPRPAGVQPNTISLQISFLDYNGALIFQDLNANDLVDLCK